MPFTIGGLGKMEFLAYEAWQLKIVFLGAMVNMPIYMSVLLSFP